MFFSPLFTATFPLVILTHLFNSKQAMFYFLCPVCQCITLHLSKKARRHGIRWYRKQFFSFFPPCSEVVVGGEGFITPDVYIVYAWGSASPHPPHWTVLGAAASIYSPHESSVIGSTALWNTLWQCSWIRSLPPQPPVKVLDPQLIPISAI